MNIKSNNTLHNLILEASQKVNTGLAFIDAKKKTFIPYDQFLTEVLSVLKNLQDLGALPGEKVVIQADLNKEYIYLFWACVLGGMVPVPLSYDKSEQSIEKLRNVIGQLESCTFVYSSGLLDRFESYGILQLLERSYSYESDFISGPKGSIVEAQPSDIAYIQFSSGSIGNPKGIVLTHNNLLTNIDDIITASQISNDDTFCSWLPLSHDMGLIGGHLTPFRVGINQVNITTNLFIRRPLTWLKTIEEYRVTHTLTSNFGCNYILNIFEGNNDLPELDLSSVKLIYNGAEPISAEICDLFLDKLSYTGLNLNSMFNVYGLAEASLAVTMPACQEAFVRYDLNRNNLSVGGEINLLKEESIDSICFVSVGKPLLNCEVRICDDNDDQLPDLHIGNIQIKGENVTFGYIDRAQTEKLLTNDGWARTGDLGTYIDGELVVTGRSKELIIVKGQNYYPHDVEFGLCKLFNLDQGKVIVISHDVPSKNTLVLVFVQYRKSVSDFNVMRIDFIDAIQAFMGSDNCKVIPIRKIPKTTSGKLQRVKLLNEYLDGNFNGKLEEIDNLNQDSQAQIINSSDDFLSARKKIVNLLLQEIVKLGVPEYNISLDASIMDYGLSSKQLVLIQGRLSRALGITIDSTVFFSYPTIAQLSKYFVEQWSVSCAIENNS